MALSINKEHSALLCLHFQNDIVAEKGAFKDFGFAQMTAKHDVLDKSARLQSAARAAGVRVIHIAISFRPGFPDRPLNAQLWQAGADLNALIEGTWGAEIHPSVAPQGSDIVVTNKGTSAFTGSDLAYVLQARGIDTLLLAGVSTNFVVESTARDACDRGFNVVVLRDCCTSMSQELHDAALNTVLPFLTTIADSQEVIAAIQA